MVQYTLDYLNTLGQTKQFLVQFSEFVHINEEVINNLLTLSLDNFEVVHSRIQHETLTIHMHMRYIHTYIALHQSFLYLSVFIIFDVAFWKLIFFDFLNASIFDTSFLMLVTVDCTLYVPYFPAMTVYDDLASIELIISSISSIVNATILCLAFSAILHTTLKFNSLRHDHCTCAIKPRSCSYNQVFK